jgi:hypothetical protein
MFGLSAQAIVRFISKVADAYKGDRRASRTFRPKGSIAYDDRILRWNLATSSMSIWRLNGRQSIPFVCGERQRALLATRHGETDLAYVWTRSTRVGRSDAHSLADQGSSVAASCTA